MASDKSEDPPKDGWVDFTGHLFSANSTNWGAIQESICGDPSQVIDESQQSNGIAADPENQYGHMYNSTQLNNTVQNPSASENGGGSNPYLSTAHNCDESDYGEILVNEDAHDAISTVTPATFVQKQSRMVDYSAYNGSTHMSALSNVSDDAKMKRRRKYLIGGIVVVALMLVTIIVVVPIVVTNKARSVRVSSAEMAAAGDIEIGNAPINEESNGSSTMSEKDDESSETNSSAVDEAFNGVANMGDADGSNFTGHSELEEVGEYSDEPAFFDVEDEPAFETESSDNNNEVIQISTSSVDSEKDHEAVASSHSVSGNTQNVEPQTVGMSDGEPQPTVQSPSAPANSPSDSAGSNPHNNPGPVPTPANNMPQNSIAEETPVPTYLFVTPAPQLPTLEPTSFTSSIVRISLQTDKQGYETSWSLESIGYDATRSTNTSTVIAAVDENTYNSYEEDSKEFTLPRGTYRFTLRDAFGDGFCCKEFEGYYSVTIDGREVIKGGYYRSEITYEFLIGYYPEMTQREKEWLIAHNVRRKEWHEGHGVSYVPLRWSAALAKQAQRWANKLTDACEVVGIDHEHGVEEGENLAKNQADGRKGMGQLYPPDNILRRWVDYEANLPNPQNLHLTQALWRASKYVGCADALREDEDGAVCRIQVCRYVVPNHSSCVNENVLTNMLTVVAS